MKNVFAYLLCFYILSACNENKSDTSVPGTAEENERQAEAKPSEKEENLCYSYIKGKDTVVLKINSIADRIKGDLEYKLAEKDKNKGTIKGEWKGDTLIADYRFSSEGMESVREVAFLKRGDELLEGYTDVEEKNGKMIFKDRSALVFQQVIVLNKVDCKK